MVADIEVGGSTSVRAPTGQRVLLARPTAETVVAFSAKCTHQSCTVEAAGTKFACPCHGSTFDAATGAVLTGPAQRPLPKVEVAVVDGGVVLA